MDYLLPGSSSARSVGKAVLMAATRLVGGSDLAEAIAEVTGLSRMSVRRMAQKATESLNVQSTDEFRELGSREQTVWAESLLVEAFSRAAARDFQVAALMGPNDLLSLIIDDRVQAELDTCTDNERGYFHALSAAVALLATSWYLDDQHARGRAAAVGVGQVLRHNRDLVEAVSQIQADLTSLLERAVPLDDASASIPLTQAGVRPLGEALDFETEVMGVDTPMPVRLPAMEKVWESVKDVEECFRRNAGNRQTRRECRDHIVRLRQLRLKLTPHLSAMTLLIVDDYVATLLEVQDSLERSNDVEAIDAWGEAMADSSGIPQVTVAASRLDVLRDMLASQVSEEHARAAGQPSRASDGAHSPASESGLSANAQEEFSQMVTRYLMRAVPSSRVRVAPIVGFDYSVESSRLGLAYLRIRPELLEIDLLTVPKRRPDIATSAPSPPLLAIMDVTRGGVVLGLWHFSRSVQWNYRWRGLPTQSMIDLAVSKIEQRAASFD